MPIHLLAFTSVSAMLYRICILCINYYSCLLTIVIFYITFKRIRQFKNSLRKKFNNNINAPNNSDSENYDFCQNYFENFYFVN